jgi:hypothetical protein
MKYLKEKEILPGYPRTLHLPHKPNAARNDLVATAQDVQILWTTDRIQVTEKVDGASVGMTLFDGNPMIRNRDHILNKGYQAKETTAKLQFRPIWNWFYKMQASFVKLLEAGTYSIYGDWMLAQHGIEYDNLSSLFLVYDLYDYTKRHFIDTAIARTIMIDCGFSVVPELHYGSLEKFEILEEMVNCPSEFTTKSDREGVYLKVSDGTKVTHRFKMVRPTFTAGELWDNLVLKKNRVVS